ncbi:HEPN domain-containing protein [Vibrio owensii]|uniref:HEPN domain-containing protein n=1 Tax=Vibrio owensii TaxID=696485 RepID=UPI0018F1E125|nr:hypothetical protein [Vibrio owensii]
MRVNYSTAMKGRTISIDELSSMSYEYQKEIMRIWFFENYQDPKNCCPYDSNTGEYSFVFGGPYYAIDILPLEFRTYLDEVPVYELIDELDALCLTWSGSPQRISEEKKHDSYNAISDFEVTINQLSEMLELDLTSPYENVLFKMIYVNVITSLEAFLQDFFTFQLTYDEVYLRRFVETTPDFKHDKFSLSEVFKQHETINERVQFYLSELLWHNLPKVSNMYKSTLDIDFPDSIGTLIKAVRKRHDLVHRAGKDKNGDLVSITEAEVKQLIDNVSKFVKNLNSQQTLPLDY